MSNPFIGQIVMFGGNFTIRAWAQCDGQLLSISQNTALFSIIGTIYGGDGRTTMGLPEMRGRVPMHFGNGPGLTSRRLGERDGHETTTLNALNLPSHTHTAALTLNAIMVAEGGPATQNTPAGAMLAKTGDNTYKPSGAAADQRMAAGTVADTGSTVTVGATGTSQAFNNMQPSLAVNFQIALQGIFPSRN